MATLLAAADGNCISLFIIQHEVINIHQKLQAHLRLLEEMQRELRQENTFVQVCMEKLENMGGDVLVWSPWQGKITLMNQKNASLYSH
ncbi:hypothetical protein SNE40_002621 [Patella caerulea]|uniref:Uncharacterized protein n=1 Tax=Patella caerulea TaxID=87958 RepID=A0AAN8KCK8_PATCE